MGMRRHELVNAPNLTRPSSYRVGLGRLCEWPCHACLRMEAQGDALE